ncbi:uncharacterized protein LOC135693758 [Rhopilema esculentum]|uniref:uncharacterized protein LOC135693758 n=1 Tax=Rhopilema esculentum TaxID=499914 RepID=UPI0031E494C3
MAMATNVYGSPIAVHEEIDNSFNDREGDSDLERPTCVCNTTCARRSGKRRGCPCKDSNLACTDACACGRKKRGTVIEWCSNGKPGSVDQIEQAAEVQDGHINMEQEIIQAKQRVQNVINDLPIETLHNLIVELAVTGEGSFEFVQDLVHVIQSPNPEANRPMALPWCKCGVCTEMGKEEENKCCKRTICVTSYYMFKKLCLDRDVLKLNITARCDLRADHMTFTMNSFRKAAYRQFALWKYGHLGSGNRRILPACVVTVIRNMYPSPTDEYMGFKAH